MAMTEGPDRARTTSYLTDQEAKEFHGIFMTSFLIFTAVAVVAHILVWSWKPWIPGVEGYEVAATQAIERQASAALTAPKA
ncbi:MAG: light-harvesting antenna LH1, beta subunit [Sphingomonadaceae bacterium]|uniref:light-harvesting antenna LH1, beta subunit n=1 Tax=Thermaurantiacus sp. TaxID=2820283 RepID=UPI00298F02E7|nr:light-harvesting antenna LH1, beta subunit [Thermaurantiacus sp.]MCS6987817.1 light-harvesting antenna LH1, beta subunit [Sphingomonadaceae bacterium]MDW8414963.1 light-harvesting antenna LH1, beta subunit [Thermaurantiacus sp.]